MIQLLEQKPKLKHFRLFLGPSWVIFGETCSAKAKIMGIARILGLTRDTGDQASSLCSAAPQS